MFFQRSRMKRSGFRNAFNPLGGMTAWKKLGLPLERATGQREAAQ